MGASALKASVSPAVRSAIEPVWRSRSEAVQPSGTDTSSPATSNVPAADVENSTGSTTGPLRVAGSEWMPSRVGSPSRSALKASSAEAAFGGASSLRS